MKPEKSTSAGMAWYEALDASGQAIVRQARTIDELPYEQRLPACGRAALAIGKQLGLVVKKPVPFGAPVYQAFEISRPEVNKHPAVQLLLTRGGDLPLNWCVESDEHLDI